MDQEDRATAHGKKAGDLHAEADHELARRRVHCLVCFLSPFRIVEKADEEKWQATIEQINKGTWDYVALHEMVGGIDVGLPAPYHLVIARDGALGLPPIEELFSIPAAVEFFNRFLAALLLGGVYCEAISADSLETGSIIDWAYIRSSGRGLAASNAFHFHVRHRQAPPLEAIALLNPQTISVPTLQDAARLGLESLKQLPLVRGDYLLRGTTGIARRDWGVGLANLWIVLEQLISTLWLKHVVEPTQRIDPGRGRRDQLLDNRTWTASTRIEMLFQKGVLSNEAVSLLTRARRARNELSHEGVLPSEEDAVAAYTGVCALLKLILGFDLPMFNLDLADHSISDPFRPPKSPGGEPMYWMSIPKLPGEAELEKAEAARGSA